MQPTATSSETIKQIFFAMLVFAPGPSPINNITEAIKATKTHPTYFPFLLSK